MSHFLKYLRNDKGGAVEYVLMIAGIGGLVIAGLQVTAVKTAFNGMFAGVFNDVTKSAVVP
jgi:Flp pilus assembly pilin Flp